MTKHQEIKCFFRREAPSSAGLHEATRFQVDSRVWFCALILDDKELFDATEGWEHGCTVSQVPSKLFPNLYIRARKIKEVVGKWTDHEHAITGLTFAELVGNIQEDHTEGETSPVFKLAELAQLYKLRMEQLTVNNDGYDSS